MGCVNNCVQGPVAATFGYYPIDKNELAKKSWEPNEAKVTIGNILDVLPIIGAIIGVLRTIAGYKYYQHIKQEVAEGGLSNESAANNKTVAKTMIARGIFSVLTLGCAGILLLITDVAIWALRKCPSNQNQQQQNV